MKIKNKNSMLLSSRRFQMKLLGSSESGWGVQNPLMEILQLWLDSLRRNRCFHIVFKTFAWISLNASCQHVGRIGFAQHLYVDTRLHIPEDQQLMIIGCRKLVRTGNLETWKTGKLSNWNRRLAAAVVVVAVTVVVATKPLLRRSHRCRCRCCGRRRPPTAAP